MNKSICSNCKYFIRKSYIDKGCGYKGGDFMTVSFRCKFTGNYTEPHLSCEKYESKEQKG